MRFAVEKAGCFHQSRWRGILPARFLTGRRCRRSPSAVALPWASTKSVID